jgi:immune inhibitor A
MLRSNPMLPRNVALFSRSQEGAGGLERCAPIDRAAVGSQKRFWVADVEAARYEAITATLQVEAEHIQMWVEEGAEVEAEALARSARVFEERIYPTNRAYFGEEWSPGIDVDVRLVVLNVQRMSAAGYFAAANELPCTLNPFSNEHEMFVMELASLTPGTAAYDSVLAHEFQHMIHWSSDSNEDAWLNEGASELAEELNGFGWPEARVAAFARDPDLQLNVWEDTGEGLAPHYGASYLFLRYFLDQFGAGALRELVAHPGNGLEGLDAVLNGRGLDGGNGLFARWVVANALDRPELDPRYGYPSLDLQIEPAARVEDLPFVVGGTVSQYAADYILIAPQAAEWVADGRLRISFRGSPTVKLVPNEPAGGAFQWWSNRGDSSRSYLERRFDLRGVVTASLSFDLWYDIEPGWDYAHVRVSTDGGNTWEIVRGSHMTDEDPTGNALGWGYTGLSGVAFGEQPDQRPTWVREDLNLTAWCGQEIVLRFEYLTDDAINGAGLCLDNLALEPIGFLDDVEGEPERDGRSEGWRSQGFVRHDNRLPQRYLVQWITLGEEIGVQQLLVDESGRGEWILPGLGDGVSQAMLAISAIAPATTEKAAYTLALEQLAQPPD